MDVSAGKSTGISTDIAALLRKARIAAGMTQAALAAQTGCAQSAVSMFEAGKRDALSRESVGKIAALLKVGLPPENSAAPASAFGFAEHSPMPFCPGFNCPSNLAYMVGVSVFLLPTGAAGNGKHCVLCGEALSALCHGCGADARHGGACCAECGAALVPFPDDFIGTDSVAEWTLRHNETVKVTRSILQI